MSLADNPAVNPGKITAQQVQHVAKLSRLALRDDELHRLAGQLESILEYVAQIDQVDVNGVQAPAHTSRPGRPLTNILRDDRVEAALPIDQVLQNAPQTDGHFFMVPKVVTGDEDSAG